MGKRHGHVRLERLEHGGLARLARTEKEDAFSAFKHGGNGWLYGASLISHADMMPYSVETCNRDLHISLKFESCGCRFRQGNMAGSTYPHPAHHHQGRHKRVQESRDSFNLSGSVQDGQMRHAYPVFFSG